MAKVAVFGAEGYVGAVLCRDLKELELEYVGFDSKWFSESTAESDNVFGDVRDFNLESLGFTPSAIVFLSAVSNDPGGERFSRPTLEINAYAVERIAVQAKAIGVTRFVVASSCSIYGKGGRDVKSESDKTAPLTTYARSKALVEDLLEPLAEPNFRVLALRFATACGPSPSQRLDLVMNDFVASAISSGVISLTSNGEPWRPLIDVRDMSRALIWAVTCDPSGMNPFETINIGSQEATLRVIDLAHEVASVCQRVDIRVGKSPMLDERSYKVDFAKFRKLAPNHQPQISVRQSILDLRNYLESKTFFATAPRRLDHLLSLIEADLLDEELRWV